MVHVKCLWVQASNSCCVLGGGLKLVVLLPGPLDETSPTPCMVEEERFSLPSRVAQIMRAFKVQGRNLPAGVLVNLVGRDRQYDSYPCDPTFVIPC